jgi:hypothetical protein
MGIVVGAGAPDVAVSLTRCETAVYDDVLQPRFHS